MQNVDKSILSKATRYRDYIKFALAFNYRFVKDLFYAFDTLEFWFEALLYCNSHASTSTCVQSLYRVKLTFNEDNIIFVCQLNFEKLHFQTVNGFNEVLNEL